MVLQLRLFGFRFNFRRTTLTSVPHKNIWRTLQVRALLRQQPSGLHVVLAAAGRLAALPAARGAPAAAVEWRGCALGSGFEIGIDVCKSCLSDKDYLGV